MPASSDHELDTWIAARKRDPAAHLAPSVMKEILKDPEASAHSSAQPEQPSWLLTSACLAAGIGKLGVVVHIAF